MEPNEPLASPYLFGLTVDSLAPGSKAVLDDTAFGWPATHLSAIPAGDYFVQAVLNRYEEFHMATGAPEIAARQGRRPAVVAQAR